MKPGVLLIRSQESAVGSRAFESIPHLIYFRSILMLSVHPGLQVSLLFRFSDRNFILISNTFRFVLPYYVITFFNLIVLKYTMKSEEYGVSYFEILSIFMKNLSVICWGPRNYKVILEMHCNKSRKKIRNLEPCFVLLSASQATVNFCFSNIR